MFSDRIVASDVRRCDWSIGSLGTACVSSFSRPLRDIYSRCLYSPQRPREPALRQMRRAIRGSASKCRCALCPRAMCINITPAANSHTRNVFKHRRRRCVLGVVTRSRTGRYGVLIPVELGDFYHP